jgi:hypothetical protein
MTLQRLLATAALAALLVPAAASSSAQEARPYKATCTAIPDDPLSPHVRATGSCQATHFGHDTFVAEHDLVPTGPPNASGLLPIAVLGGRSTHVAANGDELHSAYSGTGTVDLATGRIVFELAGHYTGGTGRFARATGATRIVGVVENGVARYDEEGSITY